jgi:ethanolamine permease
MLGMFTLIASAFAVLYLNPSVAGVGSKALGASGEPLLDGLRAIYGSDLANILAAVAVIGLVASFHAIIFAFGRQIYSVSRAGYFPSVLSVTHGTRKTPHIAMIVGSILGLAVMLAVWFLEGAEQGAKIIGGTLLNMAVFGAMFSYVMQGLSYIQLKKKFPNIDRPYKSPLGSFGAALTVIIALITIYMQLQDPTYVAGVIGVGFWFVIGIIYFALIGRHKLILSPEEEFAMSKGEVAYKSY